MNAEQCWTGAGGRGVARVGLSHSPDSPHLHALAHCLALQLLHCVQNMSRPLLPHLQSLSSYIIHQRSRLIRGRTICWSPSNFVLIKTLVRNNFSDPPDVLLCDEKLSNWRIGTGYDKFNHEHYCWDNKWTEDNSKATTYSYKWIC